MPDLIRHPERGRMDPESPELDSGSGWRMQVAERGSLSHISTRGRNLWSAPKSQIP